MDTEKHRRMSFFSTIPGAFAAILIAVVGVWIGSELVVSKAKILARSFGLSELIIGLTIVSIGTSLPEIFVNIASGHAEEPSVGVGNIIGSCFAQMTIILGLCILIGGPATIKQGSLRRDGSILLGSIILLMILGANGSYTKLEGILLVSLYIIYIIYLIRLGDPEALLFKPNGHKPMRNRWEVLKTISLFILGLTLVYGAANLIVHKGIMIGEAFGLSKVFIGILSGLGTSIPELIVSATALLRRSANISIGNLIGSNITDPLFSLGIGSVVGHYTFTFSEFLPSFLFWLAGSTMALIFLRTGWRLRKLEVAALMSTYAGYVLFTLS